MTLYSYQRQYPKAIPFRINLSDGRTRTDSSTFTAEEIADAGYTAVDDMPTVSQNQIVAWDSTNINWIVRDKTQEELDEELKLKNKQLIEEITEYRNHLISDGFEFNGVVYDSRPEDQKRISGASLLAFMAISQGAQAGDYLWHGGNDPFVWIAQDNSVNPMDAFTVIEFGKAAAFHESSHIFAARQLKDMNPIPDNYTDPMYWP
jgi:hypothetical protein